MARQSALEIPAVVMEFFFTNGTPMAYASIKLFAPHDAEDTCQTGRIDERGRFAFVPAYGRVWAVEADDGGLVEVAPNQVVPPRLKAARHDAETAAHTGARVHGKFPNETGRAVKKRHAFA